MRRTGLPLLVGLAAVVALTLFLTLRTKTVTMKGDYAHYPSVEAIAGRADMIVLGEVVGTTARHDTEVDLVVTDAEVNVLQTLKGDAGLEEIKVQQLGGQIGRTRYLYKDVLPLEHGLKYVFFLAKLPNGNYMALNPTQGVLPVSATGTVTFHENDLSVDEFLGRVKAAPHTRTPEQRKNGS